MEAGQSWWATSCAKSSPTTNASRWRRGYRAYEALVRLRELEFKDASAYQTWRDRGRKEVRRTFAAGEFLFWICGNHLGALPIYDELAGSETLVIQLNAHLDIHHFADCAHEPSHGNFLLHCAGKLPPILNVGHRDLLLPADYIASHYRSTIAAAELIFEVHPALQKLRQAARKAKRVFLDVDWDVLDPGVFPAVSQPVPFGLSSALFLRIIDAVWSERVIGVSLSEFDPGATRTIARWRW